MNKTLKRILIIMVILILIAVVIIIYLKNNKTNKSDINEEMTEEQIDNRIQEAKEQIIGEKTETSRIKNYIGQFFTKIETNEYNNAYNVLFDSFKGNYFDTVEKFEEYAKSKYPSKMALEYTKTDREGKYYIVTVDVIDTTNISNKFSQRVVVEEIGLNKFNISFQVE